MSMRGLRSVARGTMGSGMGAGMGVWEGAARGGDRDRSGVSGLIDGDGGGEPAKVWARLSMAVGSSDNSCISFSYALIPSEYYLLH